MHFAPTALIVHVGSAACCHWFCWNMPCMLIFPQKCGELRRLLALRNMLSLVSWSPCCCKAEAFFTCGGKRMLSLQCDHTVRLLSWHWGQSSDKLPGLLNAYSSANLSFLLMWNLSLLPLQRLCFYLFVTRLPFKSNSSSIRMSCCYSRFLSSPIENIMLKSALGLLRKS